MIRVTQQYISVLFERIDVHTATSTIVFTDAATGVNLAGRGESTVVFGQTAVGLLDRLVDASNTITFAQSADVVDTLLVDAASSITFTDTASAVSDVLVDAASTLSFSQVATGRNLHAQAVDTVQFAQTAAGMGDAHRASDVLIFAQSADVPLGAVSVFNLTQSADPVREPASQFAFNNIAFTQTAARLIDHPVSAVSTISFQQSVLFLTDGVNNECFYTPFIGEGAAGNPTPPPATLSDPDDAGFTKGLQLRFPAGDTPSELVTLDRSMNIGNIDRLGFDRINRESRGGTLNVFADSQWPRVETLLFTASAICEEDVGLVLDFIESHVGEEIGLMSHEGRLWRGFVTNPTEVVVQDRQDSYTVNIEFEGRRE